VQDANFNVTALLDDSGEVVERYIYDPFGQATVLDANWNVRSGGSAYDWLYLHQGGRYDVTSGLYHFRFRDYSPTLGRWTSLDPLSYAAGDVNLYRTVFNAPTVYTDPTGLIAPLLIMIVGGAAAGWWLLGPGAGTANAPAPGQENFRPPPRSFVEDALAGIPGAILGGSVGLVAAVVVPGGVGAAASSGGTTAAITGQGMTNAAIMRAFFQGQTLARTEANIAAMRWYLQIARNALARYQQMGYTGPGVATQTQRIQQILQQLAQWGVAP
jgi:RHS repeat-associated protein